jgi:hypothetical protein
MTEHPALDYNRLVIEANRLGRRMKLLHEAMEADPTLQSPEHQFNEFDQYELVDLELRLWGIGAVLAIIRQTPNAYINPEGMAAIRHEVERAAKVEEEEWAKAILDKVDPTI